MKILIAGDFCDINRVKQAISEGKYSMMFDGVKDVVQQADVRVVNFEFPIVESEGKPINKNGQNLFGQRKSIEAIKYAGFNVCTLANNHILDQGEECCISTKCLLEESGIQTVGVGNNLQDASKILYIQHCNETIAIINCCENEFSIATEHTPGSYPLHPVKQFYQIKEAREKSDYVIVIVHGGHELFQLPSMRMKSTYHFFIDVGADAVVNHHQHCYSGYEFYQNKPIFYGLGNFLFDNYGERRPWTDGVMLQIDTKVQSQDSVSLFPFIQCIEKPTITLLKEDDLKAFYNKIIELNKIISDDSLLEKAIDQYYQKCSKYELSLLEPYSGRLALKLYRMGLLPSFVNSKITQIMNHILCESHADKLKYALFQKYAK